MFPYKTRLLSSKEIAFETLEFHFEKPESHTFTPGQWGDITLVDPPETDAEGNTRGFTIASAPYEGDLIMATRLRDTAFKRVLQKMVVGTEFLLIATGGSFTLHSDTSIPAVFLSGGIGITPVRSIVLQATHDKNPHPISLFYSNHTPKNTAFFRDLQSAEKTNPHFTFVPTMTAMEGSDETWSGETGHIDKAMLEKSIPDLSLPIYYISGPQAMVVSLRKMLEDAGVKDHMIRTEEFEGYEIEKKGI
ncbi:MAG: FAD-dependent oxidoreductase [Abditibacteriaceae bacterium]